MEKGEENQTTLEEGLLALIQSADDLLKKVREWSSEHPGVDGVSRLEKVCFSIPISNVLLIVL